MGPSLAHRIRIEGHAVALAIRDPRTPWLARVVGVLVAAYALSPIDLIPDFVPFLGLLDDAVLIPFGVWLMTRLIPEAQMAEHRAAAERAAERPISYLGAALIIAVWALVGLCTWWAIRTAYD